MLPENRYGLLSKDGHLLDLETGRELLNIVIFDEQDWLVYQYHRQNYT